MGFQLVRASDTDIAIWQTEHGHIYVFQVAQRRDGLTSLLVRAAPDAAVPAGDFAAEAARFATREAEARGMLALPAKAAAPTGDRPAVS